MARSPKSHEKKAQALEEAAADRLLARATSFAEMVEHGAPEWHKLADLMLETECAHIPDFDDRQADAKEQTFYRIGVAVGRRLGGAR